jgi:hypothetical protein
VMRNSGVKYLRRAARGPGSFSKRAEKRVFQKGTFGHPCPSPSPESHSRKVGLKKGLTQRHSQNRPPGGGGI